MLNVRLSMVIGAVFALLPAAYAADTKPAADTKAATPAEQDGFFTRLGKQIGRDATAASKQAGKAYKDLGKSVAHGTTSTVKETGHEMKESAERTKQEAKKTF